MRNFSFNPLSKDLETKSLGNFCNHNVNIEDWYAVSKSKDLKKNTARPVLIAGQHLLLRRFKDGSVVAFQRYCPHMGTDLLLGKEVSGHLQCAFHGLEFDAAGLCLQKHKQTQNYNLKTYVVTEKYGFIFIYLGDGSPKRTLPDLHLDKGPTLYSPTQKITCHPHMILCNGLDKVHTKFIHTWNSFSYDVVTQEMSVIAKLKGEYKAWWMQLLNNTYQTPIEFTFTTYGSSMSVADVQWHKTRLVILFTSYSDGTISYTNTGLYMSSYNPIRFLRGAIVTFAILWQDAKILNGMHIKQNFTKEDKGVAMYREVLNAMPIYVV